MERQLIMIHHIGNDFSKKIRLNLIPGITPPPGYFSIQLRWTSKTTNELTLHHTSMNVFDVEFEIMVGRDVYELEYSVSRHNSFQAGPDFYISNRCRVDELLIMNMVCKLLGFPKKANI